MATVEVVAPTRYRWRLNDPSEEVSPRWSLVHLIVPGHGRFLYCGRLAPEYPYMDDRDEQIPSGLATCQRCVAHARAEGRQ